MDKSIAMATVADSRDDYYAKRAAIAIEENKKLGWLDDEAQVLRSDILRRRSQVMDFVETVKQSDAQALIIHVPIWADPEFAALLDACLELPILVLGNARTDSSSTVGLLGACGALEQGGRMCVRVLDGDDDGAADTKAFIRAACAASELPGKTLLRFGDCGLGILTANPNAIGWKEQFGVFVRYAEQREIVEAAEALDRETVKKHFDWLLAEIDEVTFNEEFTPTVLEKQVRSYLATRQLTEKYGGDFIGVKCQDELSDGYVAQCLAHTLMNGFIDADGEKEPIVYACESDSNGALTMYILHLLTGGASASLIDVRFIDSAKGEWILANCGGMPADHFKSCGKGRLSGISMMRHMFGAGCGGSCTGCTKPGQVTMARLCYKDGHHWMAVVRGEMLEIDEHTRAKVPMEFPAAFVKTRPLQDFLQSYGSNHIHIVYGDWVREMEMFCKLKNLEYRLW